MEENTLKKKRKLAAKKWLSDFIIIPFEITYEGKFTIYSRDSEWIFQVDSISKVLWCRYDKCWDILEKKYSMEYEEIQKLCDTIVGKFLNCQGFTPLMGSFRFGNEDG